MTPTWYVTFERKCGALPKQRSARETKAFATEAEAKAFTRLLLEEGFAPSQAQSIPTCPNGSFRLQASILGLKHEPE